MTPVLQELAARFEFYRELGIYDFYWRAVPGGDVDPPEEELAPEPTLRAAPLGESTLESAPTPTSSATTPATEENLIPRRVTVSDQPVPPLLSFGPVLPAEQRHSALETVRELIGDCQRCQLAQGRNKLVFGVGDPNARLMFVGEGPGADEDMQGEPFVGRAGQLLNNMISAMGLRREQVYIANIVKCRPPQNRRPEPDEARTCLPFLERQIEIVRPRVLVALGATAATYLLGMRGSIGAMRGRIHDYRGIQTVVTYHPAFLLRDPTQKKEAWKDLQMAMAALGLKPPSRASQP